MKSLSDDSDKDPNYNEKSNFDPDSNEAIKRSYSRVRIQDN